MELEESNSIDLEKVYDPRSVEPEMYALWERSGAFESKPDGMPQAKTFTIVIPPPNVTGALHLGHALNNTLQDILVRYHRMRGFNTLWQPGTDHAGIATQAVVERRIREREGLSRQQLGREKLVERIWQWKDEYEKRILSQLKLMGCSCDWGRNRFTLDEGMSRAVRHMFFKLFKDGLIFRGKRLVNWDTQLQTAVSDDEIYHETVKGHFWHLRYPVIPCGTDLKSVPDHRLQTGATQQLSATQQHRTPSDEPQYVVIATTRPETMLGDTAVAVHPDPEGFLDREEATLREALPIAAAKDRAEIETKLAAVAARRETHLPQLVKLRDMALAGRKLRLPLVEREIPLIADEWANPLLGSGCVKITPAHDPNDYEVGLRHKLPKINVLTPDGKIAPIIEPDSNAAPTKPGSSENIHSDEFAGLVFSGEGRAKVVADLEARGLVEAVEDRDIDLGHSDRSKLPIEPFLSDQWFVRTGDVGEPRALARADVPGMGSSRGLEPVARPDSRRTPNLAERAVLLTWTTYGTWLPGDERGFVSRTPQSDQSHEIHNLPAERYDADDPQLLAAAQHRMTGEPVRLSLEDATVLLKAFAQVTERHGIEPLAIAIMPNHVHVLCQSDQSGPELLQLFKGNASKQLNDHHRRTDSPRWWTKGGSERWSKGGVDLTAAIEYVKNQPCPICVWSFDVQEGQAAAVFESARAEARGSLTPPVPLPSGETSERAAGFSQRTPQQAAGFSLRGPTRPENAVAIGDSARAEARGSPGITLGDGSAAPGLAQAAMDAVQDGRIQIFPARYAKSYLDWLGEKREWCISRQLWWGHRIPVWHQRVNLTAQNWTRHILGTGLDSLVPGKWKGDNQDAHVIFCRKDTGVCVDPYDALNPVVPDSEGEYDIHIAAMTDKEGACFEPDGYRRDLDVLDTWFSSALWPFSTLGWPEETPHLKQYYPGAVLCTSRDIITNWVARMVMFGLYAMPKQEGKASNVPFDRVYIHPKILDGRGETMSKSKGNGVDPVDIIHIYGADALRYSMADMTTETQDIRMPVEYLCPHCGRLTDQGIAIKAEEQARKSRGEKLERRLQPADCHRVRCSHKECNKEFATQWADAHLKEELGLARDVSDRFEMGRNFCNKLWNAARFAFRNLESVVYERLTIAALPPEDRWVLARLSQTIRRYHECLATYQFSASVKELREFFWDGLCDWYIELTKPRLSNPRTNETCGGEPRASARAECGTGLQPVRDHRLQTGATPADPAAQVLALCLDQVLRLWHPTIPFITERLWQQLNALAPRRGLPGIAEPNTVCPLITADFPPLDGYPALDDDAILSTFARLQGATRAVRDLRLRSGVSPKETVHVTVVAAERDVTDFRAHAHIVQTMAGIGTLDVVTEGSRPKNAAALALPGLRVYVHDISDDDAERSRATKTLADVEKQITGKESKLSNEGFVARANPEVVALERARLAELLHQKADLQAQLAELGCR